MGIFMNSRNNCADLSVPLRKFNIMAVLGNGRDEMMALVELLFASVILRL